jgi:hypothetical protein
MFYVGFLRFDPLLCNYCCVPSMWNLQFSSSSQLGASTQLRLGEVEPSFKKFLASPSMICLGLISIEPEVGLTKLFPACLFKELCNSDF